MEGTVTMTDAADQPTRPKPLAPDQPLIDQIATELGETAPQALAQLRRIVRVLGRDRALAFLRQTQEVESQGGMLLPDGSRKRTTGGVSFRLVRDQVPPEERRAVFPGKRTKPQPAAPGGNPPTG